MRVSRGMRKLAKRFRSLNYPNSLTRWFLTISKSLMIVILPFLIFLIALKLSAFDEPFYRHKFTQYGVQRNLPEAVELHEKVVKFVKGASDGLPNEFNEREKQHLWDVRRIAKILKATFYIIIFLFLFLSISSAAMLKSNNRIMNFVGRVLIFGGALTVAIAMALLFFISFDFPSAFDAFHKLLFKSGTYVFDPTTEIIVRLYPEQIFMDLGLRIASITIPASVFLIAIGIFLMLKSKAKKIKR